MSSNNYNPYNYPYQQSSAQQHLAHLTASATNNATQASRQYQQTATTQANDYMAYQGQSYSEQSSGYGVGQDNSWNGSSYGGARETTSRAAEVLRNMSNNNYPSNSAGAAPSTFTPANNAASQPARRSGTSKSPHMQSQQLHTTHAPQPTYGQSQTRPRSVNTNRAQQTTSRGLPSPPNAAGYPSQRAQTIYNQQQAQQRSASPAQPQYNNTPAVPPISSRNTTMSAAPSQQYTDYDRRQLASVEASRTNQTTPSSASYNYGSTPTVAPPGPIAPPVSSVQETYTGQGSITVDPMAVYDPWPEYQRKQEALRAQKAIEDAARAEEERNVGEAHQAEEANKEEERKRQEAQTAASQPKLKTKKAQKQTQNVAEASSAGSDPPPATGDALESEIRAMMAKMRELNSKDPALLARIWEGERRAKAAPKSPTVQNRIPAQGASATPAPAVQANTPHVANQRRKAAPKESNNASLGKPPTPLPAAPARMQAQAGSTARHGGNTIWPPEKKSHLAAAAATYLSGQNPTNPVESAWILSMLNGNPSYIELCEQIEQTGLKLDRAAFAKNLLTAVPDVNSSTRKAAPQPLPVQRAQVPAAVMKKEIATPAAASPANPSPYPAFSQSASSAPIPFPVAEMIPINPELKPPANKEEAARKRNLSDLIDITLLSDDDDMGPPPKRLNADSSHSYIAPYSNLDDGMIVDSEPVVMNNFPIASVPSRTPPEPIPQPAPLPDRDIRYMNVVEPLEKKKALRRNNYNPATIARDVLLACGRHPSERQLNQHLDVMRSNLPMIGFDSDLSTIKWDILDPGRPPPGYFKDSVQALTEDADDEDDSEDDDRETRPRAQSNAIGGEGGARVQALPEAINPFKPKKRGRPPRQSLPNNLDPVTPKRSPSTANMSASAPRPSSGASVGYQAFRSATEYGPDGQPLPKKRGRPVGWRKAIHGSASAQAQPAANGHTGPLNKHKPSQPSSLRNVNTGSNEPIRIDSRSTSVASRTPQFQSYRCKWQNCTAVLHNLETLKKHVFKVHRNQHTLECLWDDCGKEVTNFDPNTNIRIEKHTPHSFDLESGWRGHVQQHHLDPLSWELGDGPASGLSGNED
jgi:hypothetical protein